MRRRAVVLGGGFGGMTAAGLLARAGLEVTLVEAAGVLGGKARRLEAEGLRLDTGPTLLTLPHVVRETFTRLGADDLLPPLHGLPRQCDYHFADGTTFTAWHGVDRMADEAAQLHPGDGDGLRAFYAAAARLHDAAGAPYLEAPYEGLADLAARVARRGTAAVARGLAMGTLAGLARRHLRHAGLRAFVGRFATYVGAAPTQVSAAFALIPHLEQAYGVWHVRGGVAALVDAFAAALQRLGVHVVLGARGTVRRHRAGLVAGPVGDERPSDVVVLNADPLGTDPPGPLALAGYVLLLGVRRRLALPHHTVCFARDPAREFRQLFAGDAADDPTVYVCHPAATDPTMAAADTSGLYVMVNAPTLPRGATPSSWALAGTVRRRCFERLDALVPGLARETVVLGERTPVDFAREGAPRGSLYGFLPRGRFGPFRRPRQRAVERGVYFAGGGTHPGGGVPLVMLSGRFAAQLALTDLGVRTEAA